MSATDSFTLIFDLTRRLFTDDAATAAVEAELDTVSDAVSPGERALLVVARPLLAATTPLLMFASMCASFYAAARFEQAALVLAAVILPFVLAGPARALRRRAKRGLLRVLLERARARMTVNTRALFAASAAHAHDSAATNDSREEFREDSREAVSGEESRGESRELVPEAETVEAER